MHNLKKLKIRKDSIDLCVGVYTAGTSMPADEKYGLSSQIKKSAVSIPLNIAQGAGRETEKEFYQFLNIACGSSYELQTQLIISERLKFFSPEINEPLLEKLYEVQRMVYVFKEKYSLQII